MQIAKGTYTVAEYEAFIAAEPDRRFELINGELIEKMPTQLHAYIVSILNGFIFMFLREHPIGYVLIEARYKLPGDDANSYIPDLSFISPEKGALTTKGAAPYMPDLAIEVQSPGQSDRFMSDKAGYYLENGSRMVWLVYPDRQLVEVLTPDERHLLTINSTLEGGEVLPGFSVAVREFFPKEGATRD